MIHALIDSDILIDFFLGREPFFENSVKIIKSCEQRKVQGFITPVICSNIYYVLRQAFSHEKVIEAILSLLKIVDVINIDKSVIIKAAKSDFKDFEDALQNFAAMEQTKVNIIVTRNIKDYGKSKLAIHDPTSFLALF